MKKAFLMEKIDKYQKLSLEYQEIVPLDISIVHGFAKKF
jgi:hypothetical protein